MSVRDDFEEGGEMRRGDLVGVVSGRSPWHGQVGTIVDFTRWGEVVVRLETGTRALHPQELDVAVVWDADATCLRALGPPVGEALGAVAGMEAGRR